MNYDFDLLVLGAGPGGYVAAITAAQKGLKTACVDKGPLGGTCLNVGCIPSKALLSSTELLAKIHKESASHGIVVDPPVVDFMKMMERKKKVIDGFTQGIRGLFQKNGVTFLPGLASFVSRNEVQVGDKTYKARHILIATGSVPTPLPFLPFDEKTILSSTGALALSSPPKHLLIVGAGVIGVEMGSIYRRLGSEVTFVEFLDQICPAFDSALSKGLQKSLEGQGMRFLLSHKVTQAKGTTLSIEGKEGTKELSADAVLVAIGRKPYTEGLRLENAQISTTPQGYISIDSSFRTSQPNIFAIGDIVDGPMLAHKASMEGVAVAKLLTGEHPEIDYAAIPNVIYTHPEVASVGFTEQELQQHNISYKKGEFPFLANSRAKASNDAEGFVKIVADATSHKILGIHILGPHASELIAAGCFALQKRATVEEFLQTCHPHPTLSEALHEAALAVFGKPVHL